ncbi:MAG: dephospho-CoA kinase [Acidobacteria bacterium]|nr:dephospho-CoA kinase [Acidobacteriota bacterium]
MLRTALTGGIATGKTYVLRRFTALGAATADADEIAHQVIAPGGPAYAPLVQRFGRDVLGTDEAVDRRRLGALVFSDARARRDLEAIVHPVVYQEIFRWFERLEPAGATEIAIAGIPLLFETSHEADFHAVIVTACTPELQLDRLMRRDGLSEPDARRRLAAQMPIDEKVRRADFVIHTSDGFSETDRQVAEIWGQLRFRHAIDAQRR